MAARFTPALIGATAGLALAALAQGAGAQTNIEALHRRVLTLDSHVDVAATGGPTDQASLPLLRAGGVDVVVLAVFAPTGPPTAEGKAAARQLAESKLAAIHALATDHPQDIGLASSAADVRRIVGGGKVAVIIGFLNAYWLDGAQDFDRLYAQGVRVAGLTHAGDNAFADSSRPKSGEGAPFGGLSPAGKAAVARLNDLGVLVDVSQLTPQGVLQTLAISRAPVVATHSDVRALVDNARNLSDAEIDAIAAKGGVIQVTPFNAYLSPRPADYEPRLGALRTRFGLTSGKGEEGITGLPADQRDAFMAGYRALTPRATVKQYVDHIDYIAKRVGADHVGVGSDFNHGAGVTGFANEGEAANVTRELAARGYTEAQITQIWGGNFLRVLAAAEAARRR
jgi:membrane dipeptidase